MEHFAAERDHLALHKCGENNHIERQSGFIRASAALASRFNGLSVISQSCVIVTTAVIGADLLTLVFYSIFFAERLLLDLLLTSLIVIVVASPLTYFFLARSARFAELAAELDRANRIEDLTGLLNRKTFLSQAKRLIEAEAADGSAGAMLFIDADHFKALNDRFGHAVGDAVLREIGTALKSCIRESDLAGRIGGEEFAVFVAQAGQDRAVQVCERIRHRVKAISEIIDLDGCDITVSIGASAHRPGQDLDSLLMAADRNLYKAKETGRDRIVQSEAAPFAA